MTYSKINLKIELVLGFSLLSNIITSNFYVNALLFKFKIFVNQVIITKTNPTFFYSDFE